MVVTSLIQKQALQTIPGLSKSV